MEHVNTPCQDCRNFYGRWRQNAQRKYALYMHGTLSVFKCHLKMYAKPCCLYRYYCGFRSCLSDHFINALISRFKPSAPKFAVSGLEELEVYELKIKPVDRVPNSDRGRFTIERSFQFREMPMGYTVMTSTEYAKHKKRKEPASEPMEVDESSDGTRQEYVYMLQDRTAIVAGLPIYKIGKTAQPNFDRFKGYPKGYRILLHIACSNCHAAELRIIKLFAQKYRNVKDYGSEYFMGDMQMMMGDICEIAFGK